MERHAPRGAGCRSDIPPYLSVPARNNNEKGHYVRVVFDPWLDGQEPLPDPKSSVGEVLAGPAGMLALLEARLGLTGSYPGPVVRVGQYQSALQATDDGNRFYTTSFRADPFAVAETLLAWRDELVEAGWNGEATPPDSPRLRDLAAVERQATDTLEPGFSDRLRVVDRVLGTRAHGIKEVRLQEPPETFSSVWQSILAQLPTVNLDPPEGAAPNTDLGRLQAALKGGGPFHPKGDGTVVVLTAVEEDTLAEALARLLHGEGESKYWPSLRTMVVAGQRGEALDSALSGAGLPAIGNSENAPWRSPLQVLPLYLALLWSPLEPDRLLQWLTHPVSPIPRRLANRLADAVANRPGFDGAPWQHAIVDARDNGGIAAATIDEVLDTWLSFPGYDPRAGAPIADIVERTHRVNQWAGIQAGREDLDEDLRTLFGKAAAQAGELLATLEALTGSEAEHLPRLQLERLLDRIAGRGAGHPGRQAELGAIAQCSEPGALLFPVERVLWWDFSGPVSAPRSRWTDAEREQLAAHGVTLEADAVILGRQDRGWQRAVYAASEQLLLVMPGARRGEPDTPHPLWPHIRALSNGELPVIDIDDELRNGPAQLPLPLENVAARTLPEPSRWWQLAGNDGLAARKYESFSSLRTFVDAPHAWVLHYRARLRPGDLSEVVDARTLKGNIAHRLIEWLFHDETLDWRAVSRTDLLDWVEDRYRLLLTQEGASLLQPGQAAEREALRDTLREALWALISELRDAGVKEVSTEVPVEGRFQNGALQGYIDLIARTPSGSACVIDVKWGGGKWRAKELRENRALQLATYAELYRQREGVWPEVAFFIVSEPRFYAPTRSFFRHARAVAPDDEEENLASLWRAFVETWQWRRKQLDDGWIEVPVSGTDLDAGAEPPEGAYQPDPSPRPTAYDKLTGWEPNT